MCTRHRKDFGVQSVIMGTVNWFLRIVIDVVDLPCLHIKTRDKI